MMLVLRQPCEWHDTAGQRHLWSVTFGLCGLTTGRGPSIRLEKFQRRLVLGCATGYPCPDE